MLNSTTYELLISPKYRVLRYACLCLVYFLFSYSETSYHYAHTPATAFAILVFVSFLSKSIATIILIAMWVPLLLKQRYTAFLASSIATITACAWLQQIVLEQIICRHFNLRYWRDNADWLETVIDMFSLNMLWIMVISGILLGRILKYWNLENEKKQQIEASRLQMETEAMKEQLSPDLLCNTLQRSSETAEKSPKETSDMLMKLSRLLRYQLYDCRRNTVLLDSELKFLNEYLTILKYNEACADFHIFISGNTMGVQIPPMSIIRRLQSEGVPTGKDAVIHVRIALEDGNVTTQIS